CRETIRLSKARFLFWRHFAITCSLIPCRRITAPSRISHSFLIIFLEHGRIRFSFDQSCAARQQRDSALFSATISARFVFLRSFPYSAASSRAEASAMDFHRCVSGLADLDCSSRSQCGGGLHFRSGRSFGLLLCRRGLAFVCQSSEYLASLDSADCLWIGYGQRF